MEKKFLNLKETAKFMGISEGHLYNCTAQFSKHGSTEGLPIRPKNVGRGQSRATWRFEKNGLEKWANGE